MKKRNLIPSTILVSAGLIAYFLVDLLVPSDYYKMGMVAFYQKAKYKEACRFFRQVPQESNDYASAQTQLKALQSILYKDSVNEVFWEYMRYEQNRGDSDPSYQNR